MRNYEFIIIAIALARWLYDIFVLFLGQCVSLKYKECFDDGAAPNVRSKINGLNEGNVTISNPCYFIVENLTLTKVYRHSEVYGVKSVVILSKTKEMIKMCLWFAFLIASFSILNVFLLSTYIFISFLNIDFIRFIYIYASLFSPRNMVTEKIIPYIFPSLTPCDGYIHTIDKGSFIILEKSETNEFFTVFEKLKYNQKNFFSLLKEIIPEKETLCKNLFLEKESQGLLMGERVVLKISTFDTPNYNRIDFKISCGNLFCETGVTQPNYNYTMQNLNVFLNKIVQAKKDMESLEAFSFTGNGFIHKRKNFDCTDYCTALLKKSLIVKGILDIDCALSSILNKNFKYVKSFDFENIRTQLEYANVFFSNIKFEANFSNVNCILNSLKFLLINKSGRNHWGMPNAAWKRFVSDCCWISDYRYKGLDIKKPTATLLEFAKIKNICLKDPNLKLYSLKSSKNYQGNVDKKCIDAKTIKKNSDYLAKIKKESSNPKLNQSLLKDSGYKKDLYINEKNSLLNTPRSLKIGPSVKVHLVLNDEKPTQESYKDQILKNIRDSENEIKELNLLLRDKSKPSKEKGVIKNKVNSLNYFMRDQKEVYLPKVLKGDMDFNNIRIKYKSKKYVKPLLYVDEPDKFDEKIILYNMYDVLSGIDGDEDVNLTKCEEGVKKVIVEQGGVFKLKSKINKIVKEKYGHTIDDLLLSRVAFKIEKHSVTTQYIDKKYTKKSCCPIIKRYKKDTIARGEHSIGIHPEYQDGNLLKINADWSEELKVHKRSILKHTLIKKLNICSILNSKSEIFEYFNYNYNP